MCGCLVALVAVFSPRLAFVLVWIFTERVNLAFESSFIIPLLGVIFLPWTSLIYVLVYSPVAGVSFFGWLLVIFAFLIDLGSWFGSAYGGRRYRP